jgi:hypothetical protein
VHPLGGVQRGAQRVERDGRRRQVRIAAPEVDEPRPGLRASDRRRGDDPGEVLLGEALEELGEAMNVQDV